jgi:hypothetical protein
MSHPDYVYGVFAEPTTARKVIEDLHKAGFTSADLSVVGTDCDEFKHHSAKIKTPMAKYFVRYGLLGSFLGFLGGLYLDSTIPYAVSYQVMTMLMGAVSGGIVMAYIGVFLCAFFHANEPQYYANVFEGSIEEGGAVVLAEANTQEERRTAWEIMESHEPLEVITRRAVFGNIIGDVKLEPVLESRGEELKPTLSAVA